MAANPAPSGSRLDPMANVADEIAALRGTRRATLKDLLTDASFSRLWKAMLVSSLGDWVGFVAVAALVARVAGERLGGLAVAGVMLARLLPSVLFGPFAGVFVDRFDRRKLMVGADIGRGALYASMPFMPGLWAIFGLSFVIECLSLLWTPAKDASLPNLVPRRQLSNANSVGLITTYGTLPLGATVYTVLAGVAVGLGNTVPYFGTHPESIALWLDAFTFLFSAWMVWGLDLRSRTTIRLAKMRGKLSARSAFDEIKEGYHFLRQNPMVRAMTLGIVVAFAGVGSVISLGPVFARYTVNAGSTGFGILMTSFGLGMGGGMALMSVATKYVEKDRLLWLGMIAAAICLIALAAAPSIGLAAAFAFPMGVAAGLTWVSGYTMLQENVTDEFRGRTFATLTITARMALFIALAGFPALATVLGHHTLRIGRVQFIDPSGTRPALWLGAFVALAAGLLSRAGLRKFHVARPRALTLVPRLVHTEGPGAFVVFEGVEGAGKGTQIDLARAYLESRGREVLVTREPGGTALGDRLRSTLLRTETGTIDPRAEALLFAAARAEHVASVIRPALRQGRIVLCDRYIDSSIAYQGVARGLGEPDVLTLNVWATQGLFPDLVILLDLDPERGLARAGDEPDRIEGEDLAFHVRVADAYLKIADEHPERFVVVDAGGTPEEVHAEIRKSLDRLLAEPDGRGSRDAAGPVEDSSG